MKKAIATLALVVPALALTACDTTGTGNVDTDPPYAAERTVSYADNTVAPTPVAPAERVFQRAQTK